MPESEAPRLRTHPPQPRIPPVRVLTRREGSSTDTAFISSAQGIPGILAAPRSAQLILMTALSEAGFAA